MVAFPPPPVTTRQRSSTFVELLAPFGGSSSEESHSFLSEWFKKVSRSSLAEPFGFDSRRHRFSSRLPPLSPSASPHRSPIPSSVSKAVTFVTLALYACRNFPSTFCVFYFCEAKKIILSSMLRSKKIKTLNHLTVFAQTALGTEIVFSLFDFLFLLPVFACD